MSNRVNKKVARGLSAEAREELMAMRAQSLSYREIARHEFLAANGDLVRLSHSRLVVIYGEITGAKTTRKQASKERQTLLDWFLSVPATSRAFWMSNYSPVYRRMQCIR